MHIAAFDFWLLACTCPALWKGGAPERSAAGMIAIAVLATKFAVEGLDLNYESASPIVVTIDIGLALALYGLALSANRIWPMPLASLQLCIVMAHLAKLLIGHLEPLAYYIIMTKWSYAITLIPLIGAVRHRTRVRKLGVDLAWSLPK